MPSGNKTMKAEGKPVIHWMDAGKLTIEGRGWENTAAPYDRFPPHAQSTVPSPVWDLSRNSAGIAVRFVAATPEIHCRWKPTHPDSVMIHMPATGSKGVDLYIRMPGKSNKQCWRWAGVGQPRGGIVNEEKIAESVPPGRHEFLLYLPLYNGVKSVEIGVPRGAKIFPAPPRPSGRAKPILFYGTSITQGGCASRPGMAYPAIIGRWLDRPTINLGFSGSGRMDPPVVDLLAELDPAVYVIDCCPNLTSDLIIERTEPLVKKIRRAHPGTPIVLVENIEYQSVVNMPLKHREVLSNKALRAVYKRLLAAGIRGIHYVPGKELLGKDGEATVDGVHASDLGFLRIAAVLAPAIRKALRKDN